MTHVLYITGIVLTIAIVELALGILVGRTLRYGMRGAARPAPATWQPNSEAVNIRTVAGLHPAR
jgi:hypothetical protein